MDGLQYAAPSQQSWRFRVRYARAALVAALFAVLFPMTVGCASTSPGGNPATIVGGIMVPQHVDIQFQDGVAYIDRRSGASLDRSELMARLEGSRVVLVGEQHDSLKHHRLQRYISGLLTSQGPLQIGFEMLSWDKQSALDRFHRGEIDLEAFFDLVEWEETWGFERDLYRGLFEYDGSTVQRFIALNAPRALVRALAKKGIDDLSDEERAQLPDMKLDMKSHRDAIYEVFTQHHPPTTDTAGKFEKFYAVQVHWDESMAERTATAVADKPDARFVLFAGSGHVETRGGLTSRVRRRVSQPGAVLSLVPVEIELGEDPTETIQSHFENGDADILMVLEPREVHEL